MFILKIIIRSLYHGGFVILIVAVSVSQIIFFTSVYFQVTQKSNLTMLDIGQGDSFLLKTQNQNNVLIDTGPKKSNLQKEYEKVTSYFKKQIDVVIISHFDLDHVGKLNEVIDKYKPQVIVLPIYDFNSAKFHETYTKENYADTDIEFINLFEGDQIFFGDSIDVENISTERTKSYNSRINVLYPRMLDVLENKIDRDNNELSYVFKFESKSKNQTCKIKSVLFTGDIGDKTESKLITRSLAEKINIDSDVLKIGHHGSRFSSRQSFLQKVSPQEALVSFGKNNNYGHPNQNVISRLESLNTKTFLSGKSGSVNLSLCK